VAVQGADFEFRHCLILLYLNEYEIEHKNDLLKYPNRSVWSKKTKNYISTFTNLICDKTEKIAILTFAHVKKKQRPKASLFNLSETRI